MTLGQAWMKTMADIIRKYRVFFKEFEIQITAYHKTSPDAYNVDYVIYTVLCDGQCVDTCRASEISAKDCEHAFNLIGYKASLVAAHIVNIFSHKLEDDKYWDLHLLFQKSLLLYIYVRGL